MKQEREKFSGRLALLAAFAGSAIGLGNIWRFPYMAGENGGAAFIVIYLLCSLLVALPIFFTESLLGRSSGKGMVSTIKTFFNGKAGRKWCGLLIVAPLLITSFYSVVGGWALDYFIRACTGVFGRISKEEAVAFFGEYSSSVFEPIISHIIFLTITAAIVARGLKKGIEKFNNITVPMLFVLILAIVGYSCSLPGATGGINYLLKPDFGKITPGVLASAMGQSFFSLSLGVGTILVFSSYMKKDESIVSAGFFTVIFDTVFAILAGFAIIPAVFSAGIEANAGPSLVFETLPYIFASMGDVSPILSYLVPILFFLSILGAAITSEISMLEVLVEYFVEEKHLSRRKATFLCFGVCVAIGIICSLSFGPLSWIQIRGNNIFGLLDKVSSNLLMILGSLLFAVVVGWKMDRNKVRSELTNEGTNKVSVKLFPLFYFWVRYIVPVMLVLIFITNIFN